MMNALIIRLRYQLFFSVGQIRTHASLLLDNKRFYQLSYLEPSHIPSMLLFIYLKEKTNAFIIGKIKDINYRFLEELAYSGLLGWIRKLEIVYACTLMQKPLLYNIHTLNIFLKTMTQN